MKQVCVGLKELSEKSLESMVVDLGVWIKELKVDVDEVLLGRLLAECDVKRGAATDDVVAVRGVLCCLFSL
jgi:hypothetical protein